MIVYVVVDKLLGDILGVCKDRKTAEDIKLIHGGYPNCFAGIDEWEVVSYYGD